MGRVLMVSNVVPWMFAANGKAEWGGVEVRRPASARKCTSVAAVFTIKNQQMVAADGSTGTLRVQPANGRGQVRCV